MRTGKIIFITAFLLATTALEVYGAMSTRQMATSTVYELKEYSVSYGAIWNGVAGHTPNGRDYFGLYAAGSETRLAWFYLDGTKTPDPKRLQSTGAATFEGLKPGDYVFRVYAAGSTTVLLDSTLFTIDPPAQEYRAVPADGVVTIERVKLNSTTDKVTIRRNANASVEVMTLPTGSKVTQVAVSYAVTTPVVATKALAAKPKPKAAQRSNP